MHFAPFFLFQYNLSNLYFPIEVKFALEMSMHSLHMVFCIETVELFFGRVFMIPSRGEGERGPIPQSKLWELMTNKTSNSSLTWENPP